MIVSQEALDRVLPKVARPARYSGGEWNAAQKDWSQMEVRVALAYPDAYEVGMSNLGLAILYELLNQQPDVVAERVFAPWMDMETAMRRSGIPAYSLESLHTLCDFDIVGFSLQYELNFSNVLTLLHLAGIPLRAAERGVEWPLIIAGGSVAYNPEPMTAFFDLFVVGEGEEILLELVALYREFGRAMRVGTIPKDTLLQRAASIEGVYVPSLYRVDYGEDGTIQQILPLGADTPIPVRKRIVPQLPSAPLRPVVPFVKAVHDRATVEIMRGCTRGCRFCQAGVVYRPVRERPMPQVLEMTEQLLANTGYEEVALVSLSSTDHTRIEPLVRELGQRYQDQRISVSLPSLRTDAFSVELAQIIQRTRKSGLTFAPEAGSERLRQVINKRVTAEDLLRTAEAAYSSGWLRIKLYFMIGLPTETLSDVLAIADLVKAVREIGHRFHKKRAQVSVSVATFIPKPHTPFQWMPLADADQIDERVRALRRELPRRGVRFSWSDASGTWLEAALSRGDRHLAQVVLRAWQLGARFDAWDEAYEPEIWEQAFAESGIDPAFYAYRERHKDEILPWSVVDVGVSQEYLWDEYQRSLRAEPSADCRQGCLDCGVRTAFEVSQCPQLAVTDQPQA
jgi:radical SAM family uncharacterized protein